MQGPEGPILGMALLRDPQMGTTVEAAVVRNGSSDSLILEGAQSSGATSCGGSACTLSTQPLDCYRCCGWGHVSQKCPSNQNYTQEGLLKEAYLNSCRGSRTKPSPQRIPTYHPQ